MLSRSTHLAVAIACAVAPSLHAQEQTPLVTRTISLRYLQPVDAARLVSPYIRSPQGGVYEAGAVRAVTIRETEPIIARIDSLIRENDHSPTVLAFRFQLIAADDTPTPDPAIESIASTLRGLFRYKGYHLLGDGSTTAGEHESFSLTVAAGDDRFALDGDVSAIQGGATGSTRIRVRLSRAVGGTFQGKAIQSESLLFTGLTVPLGQTIVLGSAAPGGGNKALILTVRPEVAIPPRR